MPPSKCKKNRWCLWGRQGQLKKNTQNWGQSRAAQCTLQKVLYIKNTCLIVHVQDAHRSCRLRIGRHSSRTHLCHNCRSHSQACSWMVGSSCCSRNLHSNIHLSFTSRYQLQCNSIQTRTVFRKSNTNRCWLSLGYSAIFTTSPRHYANDAFLTCVRTQKTDAHYSYRLDVRLSHAGIVSKRLNLSSNCLHCLVAPWF